MRKYYIFIAVIAVISAITIVWQSLASGPVKADQALVLRIQTAQSAINDYSSRNNRLPAGLSDIPGDYGGVTYETTTAQTYKLCGTFLTASIDQHSSTRYPPDTNYIDASQHGKGRQCFNGSMALNIGK